MASSARGESRDARVNNPAAALAGQMNDGKIHLLVACSGSVATIKLPNILQSFARYPRLSVRVILTASAARFLEGQSHEQPTLLQLRRIPNVDAIYRDEDEWSTPWVRSANILHIELRRWADLLVVAPLSANTLAKITHGNCDNLLTSVVRAWDTQKRIIVAPAMNTFMWTMPVTAESIAKLTDDWGVAGKNPDKGWFEVLLPAEKTLACGDVGTGAMREWTEIVTTIKERLKLDEVPTAPRTEVDLEQ
ncbi:flavoprotein [Thozetella sp. PMI_491]|nr:flavoprotein [Thozetella sp. PMI_491]